VSATLSEKDPEVDNSREVKNLFQIEKNVGSLQKNFKRN